MIKHFYIIIMYIYKINCVNQFQIYAFNCNTFISHFSLGMYLLASKKIFIQFDSDKASILNVLQCLHVQFVNFHFFTLILKICKYEVLFSSSDSKDQIVAPKFDAVSVSNNIVLIFLKAKWIPLLKLQLPFSWKVKTSFIMSGKMSFFKLCISRSRARDIVCFLYE